MAGDITEGQRAAKVACLNHGILGLLHQDFASMANAIYTMGPIGDTYWAVRDYFRRNHKEIELSEEAVAEIAESTYTALNGYRQVQRINKG